MLDTRSGRLLASKSFDNSFSQLQFAGDHLVFLLHRGGTAESEAIELHRYDVATGEDRLVAQLRHVNHEKVRPSQWRGTFSRDGSILAYQEEVLKPVVTLIDTHTGKQCAQVHWEGDYTALPVYFHPTQPLVAIPLAYWNGNYSYGSQRRLIVANTSTGAIVGQYDHQQHISQLCFAENGLELISKPLVGRITFGEPGLVWKSYAEDLGPSGHQQFFVSAGDVSRCVRRSSQDRTEFVMNEQTPRWSLEKNFVPVGLRGNMLVSEQHVVRTLPAWVVKLNEKLIATLGCYLLSPVASQTRYQEAGTGALLYEMHHEPRTPFEASTVRVAGRQLLAMVYHQNEELVVKIYQLFPFWTTWKRIALTGVATLLYAAWRRRSTRSSGLMVQA